MAVLRDEMSTIVYQIMEEHTVPVKKSGLDSELRTSFMKERKMYMIVKSGMGMYGMKD